MTIRPLIAIFFFLAAWLSAVLSAQESKATKPNAKSTTTATKSTKQAANDPCSEVRILMAAFVADTKKVAEMTPADREKNEQEFVTKFSAASKACSAAHQGQAGR